jgi:putative oxidoreductase
MTQPAPALAPQSAGKAKNILLWVIQVLVAAMFVLAGGAKLTGAPAMVSMYDAIGLGQWFRYVTGGIEVGSAALLLIPGMARFGAPLLGCTMIGAILTHLTVLHTPPTMPVLLLAGAAIIMWGRWGQAKG